MFAQWRITSYHTTALRSVTISSEVRPYYSSRTNNSNFLFLSLLFRTQEQNVERAAMLLQNSINWLVWRASSSYARAATVLASLGTMRAAAKWGCGGTDSVQAIPKGDFWSQDPYNLKMADFLQQSAKICYICLIWVLKCIRWIFYIKLKKIKW